MALPKLAAEQWIFLLAILAVLVPLGAYTLRLACSICKEDYPTYKRAMIGTVLIVVAGFFTFSLVSYLVLLGTRESAAIQRTVLGHPNFGFLNWLMVPIVIKWAVISILPMVRQLVVLVTLAVVGIMQVFIIEVPFRKAMLIFLLNWGFNIILLVLFQILIPIATTVLDKSFHLHIDFATLNVENHNVTVPDNHPPHHPIPGKDEPKGNLDKLHHLEDELKGSWREVHHFVDPYLHDIKVGMSPVLSRLPKSVNDWLDHGGWWFIIGLLTLVFFLWAWRLSKRVIRALFGIGKSRPRKVKKVKPGEMTALLEDLGKYSPPSFSPGRKRIAIKGIPCRTCLVVIATTDSKAEDFSIDQADVILDWIRPGLGSLAMSDGPRVRVWETQYSPGGFNQMILQFIRIPEPKGKVSQWVVASGQVKMGPRKAYLGIAFYADDGNQIRNITLNDDHWLDVLTVVENKQVEEDDDSGGVYGIKRG
ncbi:MAG: hypothetical protein EXR99_02625 [Gemmataceae bacterium]|nr:hypothetical protein [Gemmataceae bacterium]